MTQLAIPDAALAQHVIALGKTGSGKSAKLRLIVEQLLDHQVPVCIIDPKGDWWGLKSSADGKHAGYRIVIFGGEHADVPLNPHAGAHVAELVATGNRPSLIDLGGWMVGERTRFFIDFAAAFFKLTRGPRHLVIDEIHNFAPQGKIMDPDAGKMLHWANRLASEGRGKGITLIAASQRPQKVHKDFVTSCETLIACRVVHKLDRDAIKDWIDGCADPAMGKQVLGELANMKRTEAWVWSPEIDFGPERITFPMFKTYDSFKPQAADVGKLKGWAEVDLEDVRAKLTAVVAEAQANDPARLKKRIADLEEQLEAQSPALQNGAAAAEIVEARRTGDADGFQRGYTLAKREEWGALRAELGDRLNTLRGEIDGAVTALQTELKFERGSGAGFVPPAPPRLAPSTGSSGPQYEKHPLQAPRAAAADAGGGAARRILIALAQNRDGLSTRKLSILADVKRGGSTWRGAFTGLRRQEHVEESGEHVRITAKGRDALGSYEPLPTGKALRDYWRAKIGNGTRGQIFEAILSAGGHPVAAEKVAAAANVDLGGSTWRGHMARLRGLELVTGSTALRASEDLF